jgi:hypothetical protein
MDIGPEGRIQVVTPIIREGAGDEAPRIETTAVSGSDAALDVDIKVASGSLGYETAWYKVAPKAVGIGFMLVPMSADRTIGGRVEEATAPIANYLHFSPQSNFYRLFLKADNGGRAVTQMIITAQTRAELEDRTKAIDANPSLCSGRDGLCVPIPRRAAVNVWIAVSVNGTEVRVRGGTVRTALEAAGEKDSKRLVPRLRIQRLYAGKLARLEFDRTTDDILDLVLTGGETISW